MWSFHHHLRQLATTTRTAALMTNRACGRRATRTYASTTALSEAKKTVRVGFVGLGNMGLPMALNLVKDDNNNKHFDVSLLAYDTTEQARDALLRGGNGKVELASHVSDIGVAAATDVCDVIFTMLPSCEAVDSVMKHLKEGFDADNQDLASPTCFVDCSTVSPTTSRHWHDFWAENGGHMFFDAPVSGGVKGASAGTLTFMVGLAQKKDDRHEMDAFTESVQPLLELMGHRTIVCGGSGNGAATKLCNNLALAAQMVGICEALHLGEALGVDPITLTDVLNTSTAGCWSSKVNNPHPSVAEAMKHTEGGDGPPAAHDYKGGFGAKLMLKDLGLATDAADKCHVNLPLTEKTKEIYRMAALKGLGEKDFGVILRLLKGNFYQPLT